MTNDVLKMKEENQYKDKNDFKQDIKLLIDFVMREKSNFDEENHISYLEKKIEQYESMLKDLDEIKS